MKIAVLIATYNESTTIGLLLDSLIDYDVYIVDDNSPDGTAEIASKYKNVTVINRQNKRGIASAYIDGFNWILSGDKKYDKIVQMDAGMTHNPDDIPRMIEASKKVDLVIGSRNLPDRKIQSYRTLISKTAILFMRILKINLKDVTSGFRVWDVNVIRRIDFSKIRSKGFSFQLELLYYALIELNCSVDEYFIQYKLTNSSFNFKMIKEALVVWLFLLKESLSK